MTGSEFQAWLKDHFATFPHAISFVNLSPDPEVMLGYWQAALERFSLADCLEANRRMAVGLEPAVPGTDRSVTASHVAAIAARIQAERFNDEAAGQSKAWELERETDGEHRYRCRECSDVGLVICWHPETVKLAARGGAVPGGRGLYQVPVRCSCKAGNRYEALSRGGYDRRKGEFRWATAVFFNWSQWLPFGGYGPEAIAELCEFASEAGSV